MLQNWILYIGWIGLVFFNSLSSIFRLRIYFENLPYQIIHLGYNSIFIVVLTITFTGMVISLELSKEAVRYGVADMVGGGVAIAMAREFGPMLTAIVLIGRSGSSIAAEISTMKITDQIDALRSMGIDIYDYLVSPRLLAMLITQPIITIFSVISGTFGGAVMAEIYANISYSVYSDSVQRFLETSDIIGGVIKSVVFSVVIVVVAVVEALNCPRNSAGVGIAVTNAVMKSIIFIFILNFVLSYLLFAK
ncbi:MAG: ABC transporter permease [Candidatus Calescibacterium sp.]|nr:ABC transporter permease [Candidatus Calescibacterium sp.]MCX7972176.1 ABC transporter permease [bacterium]MDW8194866.1 ABC transporter permease [Candidatus Calescibacterium sp.]